jgi:hypothetical protein
MKGEAPSGTAFTMTRLSQLSHWIADHRRELGWLLAAVLVLVGLLVFTHGWWDELVELLEQTPLAVFLAVIAVLPLGGVSVALMYVVAGMRFGGPLGLVVVAIATAFHLAAAQVIAHSVLRRPVKRFLRRRGYRLPGYARNKPVALTLLGALVPGLPYIVRLYLLALSGVPFRTIFLVCWPVYVVRSGVAIFFGEWMDDLTPARAALLGGVLALKIGICAAAVWHLRRKHEKRPRLTPATGKARPA